MVTNLLPSVVWTFCSRTFLNCLEVKWKRAAMMENKPKAMIWRVTPTRAMSLPFCSLSLALESVGDVPEIMTAPTSWRRSEKTSKPTKIGVIQRAVQG